MDSDFFCQLLYSLNSINAHHHFLFGESVFEELMDLDARFDTEQISYDVEDSFHKLIVVEMNRVWINFLLIEVISNST